MMLAFGRRLDVGFRYYLLINVSIHFYPPRMKENHNFSDAQVPNRKAFAFYNVSHE